LVLGIAVLLSNVAIAGAEINVERFFRKWHVGIGCGFGGA
jgi:hypothetical protein